ncbi:hypothetical protein Hanom_Chr09g00795621 [Helianthus anomalus]
MMCRISCNVKPFTEDQKVRSELSAEIEKFRIDPNFVSQKQERYQSLAMELEASNAKAQAKQAELEEREEKLRELQQMCDSLSFVTLLYRFSTAAYQSGHHDGVFQGYFNCQQTDRITPAFQENRGKLQAEMADALEAACNDLLPVYAEQVDKVAG